MELISSGITKKWSILKDSKTGEIFNDAMRLGKNGEREVYVRANTENEAKEEAIAIIKSVVKQ